MNAMIANLELIGTMLSIICAFLDYNERRNIVVVLTDVILAVLYLLAAFLCLVWKKKGKYIAIYTCLFYGATGISFS